LNCNRNKSEISRHEKAKLGPSPKLLRFRAVRRVKVVVKAALCALGKGTIFFVLAPEIQARTMNPFGYPGAFARSNHGVRILFVQANMATLLFFIAAVALSWWTKYEKLLPPRTGLVRIRRSSSSSILGDLFGLAVAAALREFHFAVSTFLAFHDHYTNVTEFLLGRTDVSNPRAPRGGGTGGGLFHGGGFSSRFVRAEKISIYRAQTVDRA
jgi:hypothetical protein